VSIQTVSLELKSLRARLDAQRSNTHTWPTKEEEHAADLDRYDRRLLKAAAMLGVEAPVARRHDGFLLSDDDRRVIEVRLADAGIDVRAPTPAAAEDGG
jgi:flavin-dependent dehydrogenase